MPLASRFASNPILTPQDVTPSQAGLEVAGLLNPGAFRFDGKTWLLLRVAERPPQQDGLLRTAVLDPTGGVRVLEFDRDDPDLNTYDPRVFRYRGESYLTTLSHLRLAWSDDGVHFEVAETPTLTGLGTHENFGLEDCRVTAIDDRFYLSYTAVSPCGVGVGLISTADWRDVQRHGMMLPPHNKDCALFSEKINGRYYALHRPSGLDLGGNDIWSCESPDLLHWGAHRCLARTRPGMWDAQRVGAGAAPIKTGAGWLELYHGADETSRYCLGALLLDLEDPKKVIARSREPIMEPVMDYETSGFFGHVVFTNGHIVDSDEITLYYGAADEVICGAKVSIREILASLSYI